MREATSDLASILERSPGMVIVYYFENDARERLLADVVSLAPPADSKRTASLGEALANPDSLILLTPEDEANAVVDLDGSRDRFLLPPRTQPVVLFLLRGGDGERALTTCPSLASWVRGQEIDPDKMAQIDGPAGRAKFEQEAGSTPEQWLLAWRSGGLPSTATNLARSYHAMLLEEQ